MTRIEKISEYIEDYATDAFTDGYHAGYDEAWDEARNKGFDEGFEEGKTVIDAIYADTMPAAPQTWVNYSRPRTGCYKFSIKTKDNQDLMDLRRLVILRNRQLRKNFKKYESWAKYAPRKVYGGMCQPWNTPSHMHIQRVCVHARPNPNFTHYIRHDDPNITHFDVYINNR